MLITKGPGRMTYHNRVELYGCKLPQRAEFIKPTDLGPEFYFHLNEIHDMDSRMVCTERGRNFEAQCYTPIWIGTVLGGEKVILRMLGVRPYFLVRVPEGLDPAAFGHNLRNTLGSGMECEQMHCKPFKGYTPEPVPYIKVQSRSLMGRRMALKKVFELDYETAYDETNAYRLHCNREFGYLSCGWNKIRGAAESSWGGAHPEYRVYDVQIDGATAHDVNLTLDENRFLANKPNIVASWDIETINSNNTGQAPLHDEILLGQHINMLERGAKVVRARAGDRLQAHITMAAITFTWEHQAEPFLSVVFTIFPVPPNPNALVVHCRSIAEVVRGFAELLRSMQVDIVPAFNDGIYDWPFMLTYMKYYDLEEQYRASGVLQDPSAYDAGAHSVEQKLEAQQTITQHFYNVPGWTPVDVRTVFRKLMPTAEKSSLAFFLGKCKLPQKFDMPIMEMFRIFRIVKQAQLGLLYEATLARNAAARRVAAAQTPSTAAPNVDPTLDANVARYSRNEATYDELRNWLLRQDEAAPFALRTTKAGKPAMGKYPPAFESSYDIEKFSRAEALREFDRIADTVEYCRVDATLCQQLLLRRSILADCRDFGNLTSTNLVDNFYRAGGMKVRNTAMRYALRPEWNIAISNHTRVRVEKSTSKYPGAYVVPPIKGLFPSTEVQAKIDRMFDLPPPVPYPGTCPRNSPYAAAAEPRMHCPAEFGRPIPGDKLPPTFCHLVGEYLDVPIRDDHSLIVGFDIAGYPIRVLPRPDFGEDYASLYPSTDMVRNLSPETIVRSEEQMLQLRRKINPATRQPYKFIEIAFDYGPPGSSNKQKIRAWCVQYVGTPPGTATNPGRDWKYEGMGLYPHILLELFGMRAAVKKQMGEFAGPKELLDSDMFKGLWPSAQGTVAACAANAEHKSATEYAADSSWLYETIAERRAALQAAEAASIIPIEQGGTGAPHPFRTAKLHELGHIESWFRKNYTFGTLGALYEEIEYKYGYYNSKQNALKVFMNTFYGEAGSSLSPFFMVEVAGGITTCARQALHYVKTRIEHNGYIVDYGDTDSLYPMPPGVIYAELDYLFYSGRISKLIYWTRLVEITMQDADRLSAEIAKWLLAWTGTPFFKMAYEEVLWPKAFWGMKCYGGIKHEGVPNMAAVADISVAAFIQHPSLFQRGIGAKKRGASGIMQNVTYEVLRNCFSLENTKGMMDVVLSTLEEVRSRNWPRESYVRTAVYKLPGRKLDGTPKLGNPTVQGFIARIRDIEAAHPHCGIAVPELGTRYRYIAVRRNPHRYDMRGRKTEISTHERHEFAEALDNEEYKRIVGQLLPDIDYYITDEVIGALTRFACYHERFDALTAALSDTAEDKEAYKRADSAAQKAAKKYLTEQYLLAHPQPYTDGAVIKEQYRAAAAAIKTRWDDLYQHNATILKRVQNVITGTDAENTDYCMIATIRDTANKRGIAAARSWWAAAKSNLPIAAASMAILRIAPHLRAAATASQAAAMADLKNCVAKFRHACVFEVQLIQQLIDGNQVDRENAHADAIAKMNMIYCKLMAAAQTLEELKITEVDASYSRQAAEGNTMLVPRAIMQRSHNMAVDFAAWASRNNVSIGGI